MGRCRGLRLRGLVALLALGVFADSTPLRAQETRVVSGVVVDADTGAPVSDATVAIVGSGPSILTNQEGRFEFAAVPLGDQELVLRHVAYGEQTEGLVVAGSGPLSFRILVSSRAIEFEPLEVEVSSSAASSQWALGTAGHVIDRQTIEAFGQGGQGLLPVLQSRIPSLRVEGACVEYRFQQHRVFFDPEDPESLITVPCRDITVYVDGVPYPQGSEMLQRLAPEQVERIQVLSPSEAGLRYAEGSRGVILVEMRPGVGRESPYRIHINGFGWNEPQSYPWLRVLGGSAVGNALVMGIASNTLLDCSDDGWRGPPRCHAMAGMSAALLTGAMGPVITRLVGKTSYSEGRTYPALLTAVVTSSVGYLLYGHGESDDSDASRTAGRVVLAVGVPLTLTLSNRVFRMLR